jgi:hypothetical protein
LVTAGDANEDPLPAMLADVANDRRGGDGGVADALIVVVVDVGADVVLVELADVEPASAPAGAPIISEVSVRDTPAKPTILHRRSRVLRLECRLRTSIWVIFTGLDSFAWVNARKNCRMDCRNRVDISRIAHKLVWTSQPE